MADFLSRLFVDVTTLPQDNFGFAELLYLGATYTFVLMKASNMIKDGSELLLLIPAYAGIVGSIVLPVLGAVPDGAIVLFSGLGPNAQEEVAVGVGALAGSTIMLLTVPWCLSIMAGRVNLKSDGEGTYVKPKDAGPGWTKLYPANKYSGSGVTVGPMIAYTGKVMLLTLIPFLIIQVPAFFGHCTKINEEKHCTVPKSAAAIGCVVAVALFCWYLWDQARLANQDEVKQDKIDQLRAKAINSHLISIRGIFPNNLIDDDGHIQISADEPRFKRFLLPYFRKFDKDNSGSIDKHEFAALCHSLGESPDKENLDALMNKMDTDGSGSIDFKEFCVAMVDLLNGNLIIKTDEDTSVKEIVEMDNEEEEEEEEDEMPDDLAHLTPEEQQSRLLKRSFWLMGVGVVLVVLFSDPAVAVLSELGGRTGVKPFFVAFMLAPMASNGSELIAAFAYAAKKTEKTITISFAALLGAACMNNTFCLAIFLALVYVKNLKWVFYAETLSIIVVELIMYWFARQRTHPFHYGFIVLALFPISMMGVAYLESIGFD